MNVTYRIYVFFLFLTKLKGNCHGWSQDASTMLSSFSSSWNLFFKATFFEVVSRNHGSPCRKLVLRCIDLHKKLSKYELDVSFLKTYDIFPKFLRFNLYKKSLQTSEHTLHLTSHFSMNSWIMNYLLRLREPLTSVSSTLNTVTFFSVNFPFLNFECLNCMTSRSLKHSLASVRKHIKRSCIILVFIINLFPVILIVWSTTCLQKPSLAESKRCWPLALTSSYLSGNWISFDFKRNAYSLTRAWLGSQPNAIDGGGAYNAPQANSQTNERSETGEAALERSRF